MPPAPLALSEQQHAKLSLRVGRRSKLVVTVSVTTGGLLAIGALTASILLSTAVIVTAATRDRKRLPSA